jgi:N-sulfoglucosamine sulfohydrolase
MKHGFIFYGVSLLTAAIAFIGAVAPARAADKNPNILWIVSEDITTFVGAYGNREVKTPNID